MYFVKKTEMTKLQADKQHNKANLKVAFSEVVEEHHLPEVTPEKAKCREYPQIICVMYVRNFF